MSIENIIKKYDKLYGPKVDRHEIHKKNLRTGILHCVMCGKSSSIKTHGNGTFYDNLTANNYCCNNCSEKKMALDLEFSRELSNNGREDK